MNTISPTNRFGIGALSKNSSVNIETIRYYERIGIMPKPPRTDGGQRSFDGEHLKRLRFVRRGRELGFTLDDIRALLRLADGSGKTCAEVKAMTLTHLDTVRAKIADLTRMERILDDMVDQCDEGDLPDCPVLEALAG